MLGKMANAVRKAMSKMFEDAAKSEGAMRRLLNPSSDGAGSRVFPARNDKNDKNYGLRIDKGELVDGNPNIIRLKLQANSNAESSTIRDMARKNPHRVLSTADVDTTQPANKDGLGKLKSNFNSNLDI